MFVIELSLTARCADLTSVVSVILHCGSPVHERSEGYQVEEEGEHVDLEEVVGGQAFQVDEGLCQWMGQQALSAKPQECGQNFTFRSWLPLKEGIIGRFTFIIATLTLLDDIFDIMEGCLSYFGALDSVP